jgi:hypothetical protein
MAYGPGDVCRGQAGCRHLIEKRLEQMVALTIDQRDIDGKPGEPLANARPPKPAPTITTCPVKEKSSFNSELRHV